MQPLRPHPALRRSPDTGGRIARRRRHRRPQPASGGQRPGHALRRRHPNRKRPARNRSARTQPRLPVAHRTRPSLRPPQMRRLPRRQNRPFRRPQPMDYRRSRPTRRTNPARRKLRRPDRHRHRTGRRPSTQCPRLPHPAPTPPHRPRQPPAPAADGQTAGRHRIARPAPDRRPARKIPRRPRRRPASRHPDRPRRRRPHQPACRPHPAGGTRHRRTPGRSRRNAVRRIPAIRLGG